MLETGAIEGQLMEYISLQFSPDHSTVLGFIGSLNTIITWDAGTGKIITTGSCELPEEPILEFNFSEDANIILARKEQNYSFDIFDTTTGKRLQTFKSEVQTVWESKLSNDGTKLFVLALDALVGYEKMIIRMLDLKSKRLLVRNFEVWGGGEFEISADGGRLINYTGDDNNAFVTISDTATGTSTQMEYAGEKTGFAISGDGTMAAVGIQQEPNIALLKIFDTQAGETKYDLVENGSSWSAIMFSNDGQKLNATLTLTANDETQQGTRQTYTWDLLSGEKTITEPGSAGVDDSIFIPQINTERLWDISRNQQNIIEFIQIENKALLGTFYLLGENEWAITTPSGVFDASPGAMKLMYYLVGLEVIELDQLKGRYWQPNFLSVLLNFETGTIKNVEQLTRLALYPEIVLLELNGPQLNIQLSERSGGIGRTSFRINNKEREQDINKDRTTKFSIDLSQYEKFFIAGENTLAIRCWNKEDWLPGPLFQIKYYNTVVDRDTDENPSLYGLFVGTSNYKNDRFSLTFPDMDASYLSDAVKIVGEQFFNKGTGQVNIRLLTTDNEFSPNFSTKTNIKAAFDEFAQQAKPQDVVVIFFTGHGANYDNGQKTLYYYLTHDIVSDNLSDDAVRNQVTISSDELCTWVNAIPAMKQVLILDTCYSGKVVDALKSKNANEATRDREMERMKDRTGMYVLTGSAADKVSYEANNYGQGLLTYTLLMGMRGAALMKNTNQQVSSVDVMKLFSFSREEVERLSKEFGVVQQPTLRAPVNVESFAIGLAPPGVLDKIKLAMPKPVFVHSNFMGSDDFLDGLNISEMLDQYLMGSIGIGNRPQAIFIDVNNFPGAFNVRGLYSKTPEGYQLRGKVYRDKDLKGSFEIEGQGMEDMVPKIAREVEIVAFPIADYKVPEDDEIGAVEKGLKDDLDKINEAGLVNLVCGYKENFIGEKFKVPLPKLHADHLKDVALLIDPTTKAVTKQTELKYQYYSTIHNRKRKFPFFAACNLHGAAFLSAGRNGVFVTDPRIPKEDQCGDELYTYKYNGHAYTSFCHRGHMSKREDPQWTDKANLKAFYASDPPAKNITDPGAKDKAVLLSIAERGARLTFFFTNAVPQHGHLNGVVWRSLEDYIMAVATNNKKAEGPELYKINIMTGPVFQENDPVFPIEKDGGKKTGIQVPTLFWKVIYFKKEDGKLYHIAFLMGQAALLKAAFDNLNGLRTKDISAAEEVAAPFEGYKDKGIFQVKVSFIESLTKLKFHPAVDPYNDSRPAKEIIEKVQLAKKGSPLKMLAPGTV